MMSSTFDKRANARSICLIAIVMAAACQDGTAPLGAARLSTDPLSTEVVAAGWKLSQVPRLPDAADVHRESGFDDSYQDSEAFAINDAGTIVGSSDRSFRLAPHTQPCVGIAAFMLRRGVLTDLTRESVDACEWNSSATDVNANDVAVGWFMGVSGDKQPFIWSASGGLGYLLGSGNDVIPTAINDHGLVVGYSEDADAVHAVLWRTHGSAVDAGPIDIHPPDYANSWALDVKKNGVIVGIADGLGCGLPGGADSPRGRGLPTGVVRLDGYGPAGAIRSPGKRPRDHHVSGWGRAPRAPCEGAERVVRHYASV